MNMKGFSLVETLVALTMVALAAMLMVRASSTNASLLRQAETKASAMRLATELAAWARRGGGTSLGMSLPDAIGRIGNAPACHDGSCSAEQGDWHLLSTWHERLHSAVPGVRLAACTDGFPDESAIAWDCDPSGGALVLKLGWPPQALARPAIAIPLAGAR